ncbi:MAG TPA: alpha/beta hydrolase [Thermoleophilaceae bacterium]|nr:alpha/beta hydrolase [Thermoleophilaceae bacterium]
MRGLVAVAVALCSLVCGCSHHHHETAAKPAPRPAGAPRLVGAQPCGKATCATLTVPLDHGGRVPGRLTLRVAIAGPASAPHGTLVFLTGGPGQPGVPFLRRVQQRVGSALDGYRLVMFDQRGTGRGALRCPQLQSAVGSSDLTVPPASAVAACATALGAKRAFFTTQDTVGDLDLLRQALGVDRITLDGISYGTFVAERYALAHPGHVARLVLDSVVPQTGINPFQLESIQSVPRVLRSACAERHCGTDPANDLAAVIRGEHNGPALLDLLVTFSVFDPDYRPIPGVLAAARAGHPRRLERLMALVHRGGATPASLLSQGLHASTICADYDQPWGGPDTPLPKRTAAIQTAAARLTPATLWPFDRATATGNGELFVCERWPPENVTPPSATGSLPNVPTLLLVGERDLSTPLPWAQAEARHAPQGKLVVVRGAGHATQLRGPHPPGVPQVARFLQG